MRDLTEREKEIVILLADCNMNFSEAARRAYAHRGTILYHVEKIKRNTGLDPSNFYDLVKLVGMANMPL